MTTKGLLAAAIASVAVYGLGDLMSGSLAPASGGPPIAELCDGSDCY